MPNSKETPVEVKQLHAATARLTTEIPPALAELEASAAANVANAEAICRSTRDSSSRMRAIRPSQHPPIVTASAAPAKDPSLTDKFRALR